ncbi:MAG: hypothetical protein JNJ78_00485 [Anaerolineae bacterium]|nr:hypothetical protein [Anaerolineae bacterium]
MNGIVFFIEQIASGLYILIAVGLFWTWRRWSRARQDLRATHFELERDIYRYEQANAATMFILLIQVALVVMGIQQVVAPSIRANLVDDVQTAAVLEPAFNTPTPPAVDFSNSPIDSSGVVLGGDANAGVIQSTAAPTLTPVGTILPNPAPVEGCDSPEATLQIPANGMLVFNTTRIVGTAYTDNFSSYRFELNGPSTQGNFAPLAQYTVPVTEVGELGNFVPSFYEPGAYQFRLTVFDINGVLKAACGVNITISEPIPTATPLVAP